MKYTCHVVMIVLLLYPALLSAQVELPPGTTVDKNAKGDFFDKQKRDAIFDASPGELKSDTQPRPRATPVPVEATPTPTPEAEPEEQSSPRSNLKNQILDRAQSDRGMMDLLNRSRQIKEQLGVNGSDNKTAAPSRSDLRKIIEGVKETADEDPKKKNKRIAFNGPDLGGSESKESYTPKSVLSLIVSGADTEHLSRHTRKLSWMAKHRNVKIGNVFIVGMSTIGASLSDEKGKKQRSRRSSKKVLPSKVWLEKHYAELSEAGLGNYEMVQADRLFDRLDINFSPTWVVRHLGRDYLFEGYNDPVHVFTKKGEFVRADY